MIDADELFKDNSKEAFDAFFANKKIIPITDNLIKLDNIVYELDEYDMHLLLDFRCAWGYPAEYDGFEKTPGEAWDINGMYHAAVSTIVDIIRDENAGQTAEKTTHKIVAKIIK